MQNRRRSVVIDAQLLGDYDLIRLEVWSSQNIQFWSNSIISLVAVLVVDMDTIG